MPLKFDKTTEDRRGKIIWLSSGLTKINIVEIRSGFARGGHYHNHETTHFVISGKIEYREKNIETIQEKINWCTDISKLTDSDPLKNILKNAVNLLEKKKQHSTLKKEIAHQYKITH